MRCLPDYKKEAFVSSRLPPHPACANCLAYTLPLGSAQATFPSKGNVINLSHLSTNFFARSKMSERIRLTRSVAAAVTPPSVTPPNEDAAINKRFQNEASSQPIFSIPGIPIRFIAVLRYGGVTVWRRYRRRYRICAPHSMFAAFEQYADRSDSTLCGSGKIQ